MKDENSPTVRKHTCLTYSGLTKSRYVDPHVSGTPQTESLDQVTPLQLHTVALPIDAF